MITKCKMVAVFGLALICLVACKGTSENDNNGKETTVVTEKETKYDVEGKIASAKKEASELEKKMEEDGSLTQADMNQLSNDIYAIWDNTMSDMLRALKETVDEKTMKDIEKEQQDWVAEKEQKVKAAQAEFEGGSMAVLAGNQKAAELTEERVNELKKYFSK